MNNRDQSLEESNVIDEIEIEQASPASNSPTEKRQMERATKPEEDSSSYERDQYREDIRRSNPHDYHENKKGELRRLIT